MIPFQSPKQNYSIQPTKTTFFSDFRCLFSISVNIFMDYSWHFKLRFIFFGSEYAKLHLQPFSFSYIQGNPELAALHVSTHSVFLLSMQPDCFYLSFSILQNKKNKGRRRMKRHREKQKYIYVVSYFLFPQGLISKYKLSQGLFLGGWSHQKRMQWPLNERKKSMESRLETWKNNAFFS